MIKKFLIIAKHIYLQSKVFELHDEQNLTIELLLPIEKFWELEKVVKQTDFYVAAGDSPVELRETQRRLFRLAAPYAVQEKQRTWLYEKAAEQGSP